MIERGLATLARVHTVDWRAAGLDWLVPPGSHARSRRAARRCGRRTTGPSCATGRTRWSTARSRGCTPSGRAASPVGLCWGDPAPGQHHLARRRAGVRDRLRGGVDRAAGARRRLVADVRPHHARGAGVDRARGRSRPAPSSSRMYEAASGRAVPDARWFEICAATRYCAIVVRVMNRAVDRGLMPEDHTIWLENPAVTALESAARGDVSRRGSVSCWPGSGCAPAGRSAAPSGAR